MKLTEELKEKVDAAETLEEKKSIMKEAGIELSDDELEDIAGGISDEIPFYQLIGGPLDPNENHHPVLTNPDSLKPQVISPDSDIMRKLEKLREEQS